MIYGFEMFPGQPRTAAVFKGFSLNANQAAETNMLYLCYVSFVGGEELVVYLVLRFVAIVATAYLLIYPMKVVETDKTEGNQDMNKRTSCSRKQE